MTSSPARYRPGTDSTPECMEHCHESQPSATTCSNGGNSARTTTTAAFTLVEVAIGMALLALISLGLLAATMQARRMSEEAIIQNAAASIVYGLVEQMKTLNLSSDAASSQLPSPADADCAAPHVKLRVDNSTTAMVYIRTSTGAPPATTPSPTATAASLGATSNIIGPFDLSQTSGVNVQPLYIDLWLWIEPDYQPVAMESVTRATLVYSFTINTGSQTKTFRDSIRFVRANRNIPRST